MVERIGSLLGGLLPVVATAALLAISPAVAAEEKQQTEEPLISSESLAGNYLAARIAATDKDTEAAVAFYRKALERDPDNSDLKLKAFLNFIANGDFEEGVAIGRQLEKNSAAPDVISLVLAAEEVRKKSWPNAERILNRTWRSPLDRLMSGLLRAWIKQGQGKTGEGLAIIDGLEGPAWYDLFKQYQGGLVALAGGDTKAAVDRLAKAVENRAGGRAAQDTYMRTAQAFVKALWKSGDKKRALDAARTALTTFNQNPIFEALVANLEADKAPSFDVNKPQRGGAEVFLNLGTAIDREGGEQFARIYLQLATMLAPKDDAIAFKLAEVYDRQSKLLRANALFGKIKDVSPYYAISKLEIALNLDELEQIDEARKLLDELVADDPDDLVVRLSYGAVLARHEKYGDAISLYKDMLERIDTPQRIHWNLYYRLGIAYERTKQWPLAEAAFKEALKLYPDQPSVLNYLGYSWVDMNVNLQEGLDMIRKAVELRPNDGYMVDSLGWAYYRLNRFQEAVVELERAVELRPGDPTINDHLGDAYWQANRRLEATFQWRHALALDPPEADIARIEDKLERGLDAVLADEKAGSAAKKEAANAADKEG